MELYIGSHLSTAGGWNALLERSHEEGGTAFAFFPRSPYGKRSKALDPAGAAEVYINIHPGAHVGQGAETGCRLISEGLNQVFERADGVMVLLETMAGKGTECGRNFEELATIMNGVENKANVGVTFDTCHALDAGYDLENDYDGVMRQLNEVIGLARVKAIHVNDSQFGLGSHKDRHANIGEGQLGIPFFTRLVNDPTMAKLPMILETKEQTPTTHRDEIALLRGLVD